VAQQIDARGFSCPQPVVLARRAIERGDFPVVVLVDTVTSRENVRRIAEKAGLVVKWEQEGDDFRVIIDKRPDGEV